MKRSIYISTQLAAAFLLTACSGGSGKSDAENLPFRGMWHTPGAEISFDINEDRIQLIDKDDMNPMLVFVPYTEEKPGNQDRLKFVFDEKYPGTVVFDRSKETVTFTIKDYLGEGEDYVVVFEPKDRLDRITPYVGADYREIYSTEDKSTIDTLYRGESVRWIDDTLRYRRVLLPDGRRGYMEFNNARPTRGVPSDLAYERSYKRSFSHDGTYTYSFERKGDDVIVNKSYLPENATRFGEEWYLGKIDGHHINVDKQLTSGDVSEGNLSGATPLDTPFTISVIDNDDNPYIVIDGLSYRETEY